MKLTVITNRNQISQINVREGSGKYNNPEMRQIKILETLKKNLAEKLNIKYIDNEIELEKLHKIHSPEYLYFLTNAYDSIDEEDDDWIKNGSIIPDNFYKNKLNNNVVLYKQSGYFCGDCMTPIFKDTSHKALISANQAYHAHENICDSKLVYILCNSPGHHAKYNEYNGYCYINNALVCADKLLESYKKISVLDLDYHAGQGTADIVYKMNMKNVMAISIHMNPKYDYPSLEGFENDYPENDNIKNFVVEPKCDIQTYLLILEEALEKIIRFETQILIIAFGTDTYKDDPDVSKLGGMCLLCEDYKLIGNLISKKINCPIVITQEGGYNLDKVGDIVCNLLSSL